MDRPSERGRRRPPARGWSQRCEVLFEELRKPARAMVSRAYGKALTEDEIDDVYAAAWTSTLSALRTRGEGMCDEELRAYVLTAVASHASKELRRRSRRPAGSLDHVHAQVVADRHQPLPEEIAIGSETRGIARDLLSSLPARRRAVMLLRYGWGLSPTAVCALVDGLSPRAYRKEVTRGVEQLIERLKQVETGEWCESREPLLRDYLAGTADEAVRRQVKEHLEHCRACSGFTARLGGHLHDLGGMVALSTVAGSIGASRLPGLDRIAGAFHAARDSAASVFDRGESSLGALAASGGARGSGAAGAGILAKLAGFGGAGKIALACLGAGAAASACVAAGVVPGVSFGGSTPEHRSDKQAVVRDRFVMRESSEATPAPGDVVDPPPPAETPPPAEPPAGDGAHDPLPPQEQEPPDPPPVTPAPAVEEFDPVAPTSSPSTSSPAPPSPVVTGSVSQSGSPAHEEFGP